jgi:hypothetical protein
MHPNSENKRHADKKYVNKCVDVRVNQSNKAWQ